MKLILVLSVILALSFGLSSAGRTECTHAGCVKYDNNGGGTRCGYNGCERFGPQRYQRDVYNPLFSCGSVACFSPFGFQHSPPRPTQDTRNPDPYVTTGTAKCGFYGCVTH